MKYILIITKMDSKYHTTSLVTTHSNYDKAAEIGYGYLNEPDVMDITLVTATNIEKIQ